MKKVWLFVILMVILCVSCSGPKTYTSEYLMGVAESYDDSLEQLWSAYNKMEWEYCSALGNLTTDTVYVYEESKDLLAVINEMEKEEMTLNQKVQFYHEKALAYEKELQSVEQAIKLETIDSAEPIVEVVLPEKSQGNATIFCPREMIFEETVDVYALISEAVKRELVESKIRERIRNDEGDENVELVEGENLIFREIQFYEKVKIEILKEASRGFEIVDVHRNPIQVYKDMSGWHWRVTPVSDGPNLDLVFKVTTYDLDGSIIYEDSKVFKVTVKIRPRQFIHNAKIFMIENPKWTMSSILIPLITFFWGQYNGRRKKKKMKNKADTA